MVRKRKKDNDNLPDNRFEFGAFAIKHFLKVIAVIIALGIAITGFSLKCGDNEITKDPIYQRVDSKNHNKE